MTMKFKQCVAAMLVLVGVSLALRAQNAGTGGPTPPAPDKSAPKNQAGQHASEGERIFAQNCSRCHTAPDGFSPHISGTIVMHMRVRASLSKHDTQELMRFFNP